MKSVLTFVASGLVCVVPLAAHATVTPGCKNPVTFGAVANDRIDDRVAFQAAIDAAIAARVDVCIPAGRFDLTRFPSVQKAYSVTVSGPVRITGEGRDVTQLKMFGTGIVGSGQRPGPWSLVEVRQANRVYLADLALDGSERVNTQEHTHLLQLNGPLDDVTVERIELTLPVLAIPPGLYNCSSQPGNITGTYCFEGTTTVAGFFSGGDCARFAGNPTNLVQNVVLRDVSASDCDRAAFAIQQGVDNLLIEDSLGVCHDDQALDFEPSGTADALHAPMDRVTLSGVDFSFAGTPTMLKLVGRNGNRVATTLVSNTTATGLFQFAVEYNLTGGASPPSPNPVLSGNSFSSPTQICVGYSGGGCVP